jgi:hypothetical protein
MGQLTTLEFYGNFLNSQTPQIIWGQRMAHKILGLARTIQLLIAGPELD